MLECQTVKIECLKVLVKFVRPDVDDVEMARICALRTQKLRKNVVFGTVISDMSVVDIADDLVGHEMKDEMVQAAKDYNKAVEALELAAVPKAKAAPAKKKKRKFTEKDILAVEAAKGLIPDHPGCTIAVESIWHLRFKATYPTIEPPHSTSMCFEEGDKKGKKHAMLFCIAWIWRNHEIQTGELCPWELTL